MPSSSTALWGQGPDKYGEILLYTQSMPWPGTSTWLAKQHHLAQLITSSFLKCFLHSASRTTHCYVLPPSSLHLSLAHSFFISLFSLVTWSPTGVTQEMIHTLSPSQRPRARGPHGHSHGVPTSQGPGPETQAHLGRRSGSLPSPRLCTCLFLPRAPR